MPARSDQETVDLILAAVLDIIDSEGHEAVQMRRVATDCHLSLATIYRHFATRDALILGAVQRWMAANSWSSLSEPPPDENLHDSLMRVFRQVFEPWERSPNQLRAYHQVLTSAEGGRLEAQGLEAFLPLIVAGARISNLGYLRDLEIVLSNVTHGLIARVAAGTLDVTGVLPALERTVTRLVSDNEAEARRCTGAVAPDRAAPG